ncbi:MAG TPA: oligosaccharide flippase family protein [Ktedonobacteraceae bacterium]
MAYTENREGQAPVFDVLDNNTALVASDASQDEQWHKVTTRGEHTAQRLLRSAPRNYLLNQVYGFWFFLSTFLLTLIITHTVSTDQYGVYAVALTAFNTIQYIVALGLEDATTTFVPRVLAEHGQAAAALLIRRLLGIRVAILAASMLVVLYALPVLAYLIGLMHISGAASLATSLRNPELLGHVAPIAVYVLGSGVANLLMALCAALMRMHLVFFISGAAQLLILLFGLVLLQLGLGIDSILWLLAITSLLSAAVFALWLAPHIFSRGAEYRQPLKPVLQLGVSAWLTNLASGALFKQVSIILLGIFAASLTNIAYFNLSFQLADAANTLLVAGLVGVGGSALAAAFVGGNRERLARTWQALIKAETLLAATGLAFCLFNAPALAHALYGSKYDAISSLFMIFLFFNILTRVLGTTIHQSALYVLGRPQLVVVSQWLGFLLVILLGIALIPPLGAAGALIADGVARVVAGALMLFFLLKDVPRKYPLSLLGFTLRFLCVLALAGLPALFWHPVDRFWLIVSGCLFVGLCAILLRVIRPLNEEDVALLEAYSPRSARYLRWFMRKSK